MANDDLETSLEKIHREADRRNQPSVGKYDTRGTSRSISLLDDIDNRWRGYDQVSAGTEAYFDYYFSGQDIRVYVDGTEDDPNFQNLPIMDLGYQVNQEKAPVFGFWSYTYDAIMRGKRIVIGSFTLATKYPDYMKDLLTLAAESRAKGKKSYNYYKGLTEDDKNIEKYWSKNMDPSYRTAAKNVFSVHPPFSLVIVYGVQNVSLSSAYDDPQGYYSKYQSDNPLLANTNERLVESDSINYTSRVILDACELLSMERGFDASGNPISEQYSFIARDIISPPRDSSTSGQLPSGQRPSSNVPGTTGSGSTFRRFQSGAGSA